MIKELKKGASWLLKSLVKGLQNNEPKQRHCVGKGMSEEEKEIKCGTSTVKWRVWYRSTK